MQVKIIRIGNSRGVRIPRPIIEQCGLGDTADLRVEYGRIVITPGRSPREGWANAFAKASDGDDMLLESGLPNRFDHEGWYW